MFLIYLDCIIYAFVTWIILKLGSNHVIKFKSIRNALILSTFPQILHLLFVIWDYPRNDHFGNIINIATFTSHFAALSSICPNSKVSLLAIILAHLTATQVKRII